AGVTGRTSSLWSRNPEVGAARPHRRNKKHAENRRTARSWPGPLRGLPNELPDRKAPARRRRESLHLHSIERHAGAMQRAHAEKAVGVVLRQAALPFQRDPSRGRFSWQARVEVRAALRARSRSMQVIAG